MSVIISYGDCEDRGHAQNQWEHAASHWPADMVCNNSTSIPEGYTLVVLSPAEGRYVQGTESLVDFVHPENAVYLFGSNHSHLTHEELPKVPDHIVYIPIAQTGYVELYSWVALAVVMYDRMVKGG